MFTISEAYNLTLQEADKMGSDYLSLPEMFSLFKKETIGFVRERAKEVEKTEEITDDIRPLINPTKIAVINNPDNPNTKLSSIPNNLFRNIRVNVQYTDGLLGRQPLLLKHGEVDRANSSPYRRASKLYPIITQYQDYFEIDSGTTFSSPAQPQFLILTYIEYPTFGDINNLNSPIVNLDDAVCEILFSRTANQFMVNKGDPRTPLSVQYKESFGDIK